MFTRVSKVLTFVFGFALVAEVSFAARFERIDSLANSNLQKLKQYGDQIAADEVFGVCGMVSAAHVKSKKSTEKWENTIKQILWGQYTDSMDVVSVGTSSRAVADAVTTMTGDDFDGDLDKEEAALKLKRLVTEAVQNGNTLLFKGGLEGAFSTSIGFLTIVNLETMEVLAIGDGYCE